ncbi:MAG: hypothetical protein NZU63_02110 [Gemmataceae bacterium]|nr:hypothetical protein [Gemmataceae bacterium]MDW8242979.1 hypothetical protein [Thermogemmata sp.]
MTAFGKVLLVFNFLLALGFSYLATQDWQRRQTIQGAALRYDILVQGLPLGAEPDAPKALPADPDDPIPFRVLGVGNIPTTSVSKKFLESYFQALPGGNLGGGAVPNQLAEVQRVRGRIDQLLAAADTPQTKLQLLRGWLLYQAESYEEHQTIEQLVRDGNVDELQKRLNARFEAVMNPPRSASIPAPLTDEELAGKGAAEQTQILAERLNQLQQTYAQALDESERRMQVAHLLIHLDPSAEWQKRVAAVVGLSRYTLALVAQARRYEDMCRRMEELLLADQQAYLERLRPLQLAAQNATELTNRQAALRAKWVEQFRRETDAVAQRETQLRELANALSRVKAEVDALLAQQHEIEIQMFTTRREVATALEEVYRLEAELVAREKQLLQQAGRLDGR